MCCVIPPASRAVTFVARIASSRLVLPWSTWPRTVMTGGRSLSLDGSTSSHRTCLVDRLGCRFFLGRRRDFLLGPRFEAELVRYERRGLEVDGLVDRDHRSHVHEAPDDIDDAHV